MTRVLLAFDKFKDSISAQEACEAAAAALHAVRPEWTVTHAPLADGGEGFAEILTRSAGGRLISEQVTDPRGNSLRTEFGLVAVGAIPEAARNLLRIPTGAARPGEIAIVEMARASGLALLPDSQRDPWLTTSRGTGELMLAAARRGAVGILLGVGGSATNDLGLGALARLGFECRAGDGSAIDPPVPARWKDLATITGTVMRDLPPVFIACDVTNPLLGERGAAAVYGFQKGLRKEDLPAMEKESERIARLLCAHVGRTPDLMSAPGAGAAGGIAFGLMAGVGARLLPGFDLVSAWLDLEAKVKAADIVITGEGRFDESSLEGKGPGAVAARALQFGKTVHVFAGQIAAAERARLNLHAITPLGVPLPDALRDGGRNLGSSVRGIFSRAGG